MRESHTIECMRSGVTNCTCNQPKVVHEYGDGWQVDSEGWRTNPTLEVKHKGKMHNAVGRHRDCHTQELACLAAEVERHPTREWYEKRCNWYQGETDRLVAERDALAAEVERLKVKLGQRADDCLTLIAQRDALAAEVERLTTDMKQIIADQSVGGGALPVVLAQRDKLAERVRELGTVIGQQCETITDQAAEITRLRERMAYMLLDHKDCGDDCQFCNTEKMEAEITRLREALSWIAQNADLYSDEMVRDTASQALKGES